LTKLKEKIKEEVERPPKSRPHRKRRKSVKLPQPVIVELAPAAKEPPSLQTIFSSEFSPSLSFLFLSFLFFFKKKKKKKKKTIFSLFPSLP